MPGGSGFDTWRQGVQHFHDIVKTVHVLLYHLHGFQLFESGLFGDLVLAVAVSVALQVAHIGDIADISYAQAEVEQIAVYQVKAHEGAAVAEVHRAVHGRSADVHAHGAFFDWFENFFLPAQAVENCQLLIHSTKIAINFPRLSYPAQSLRRRDSGRTTPSAARGS